MRLKSLDKYIKDKVQGYKAPYEADMWKGIEEKLPAPRVPNGRGSWMLPVAAVVALAILAPFTIKFYNLTGRSQVMALRNDEVRKSKDVILSNNSKISAASPNPGLTIASVLSPEEMKANKIYHYRHFSRNNKADSKNDLKTDGSHFKVENVPQQVIQKTTVASNTENGSKNEPMSIISPGISTIEDNANADITNPDNTRYPDRSTHHPINDQKWENWQSIYYPFWDNPANAGYEGGKLNITVDNATDNIANPNSPISPNSQYTYTNFGAETYLPSSGVGVGAYRLGTLSPTSLQDIYGLAVSKSVIQAGSTSVKLGVSGTVVDDNLFNGVINYSDQINPKYGFINATSEKSITGTTQAFAVNAGLSLSSPHVIADLDVTNINEPKPSFTSSDAEPLPRQLRATLGYRFAAGSDLQFMPMAIVTRENRINQLNTMFTAVYKDKYMLSLAYENIDPISGLGNVYIYGAVRIAKRFRVFGSYGRDLDLLQAGINETFVHAGLNILVIK